MYRVRVEIIRCVNRGRGGRAGGRKATRYENGNSVVSLRRDKKMRNKSNKRKKKILNVSAKQQPNQRQTCVYVCVCARARACVYVCGSFHECKDTSRYTAHDYLTPTLVYLKFTGVRKKKKSDTFHGSASVSISSLSFSSSTQNDRV